MAGKPLEKEQEQLRIPLYAHESQRLQNVNATFNAYVNDQFLVNCYPVVGRDPLQADKPIVNIQSRLGWNLVDYSPNLSGVITNTDTAYVVACKAFSGLVDVVVAAYRDGTDYKIVQYRTGAASTLLLTIPDSTDFTTSFTRVYISELATGAGNTVTLGVVLTDSSTGISKAWFKVAASGVFAAMNISTDRISDTDFPGNISSAYRVISPLVQLNENIYVATVNGNIYNSELDGSGDAQLVNWNTLGYVPTSSYNDTTMGLLRYKHHLLAFGQQSIEFFNDEGIAAPASPLAPTAQAFIKLGTVSNRSFINIDDTVWWVATSSAGQLALYKLDGYTPVLVSQPPFSKGLEYGESRTNLQVTTMHGMKHLVFNLRALATQWFTDGTLNGDTLQVAGLNNQLAGNLCYCIDTNTWWIWASEHEYAGGATINNNLSICEELLFTSLGTTIYCWSNVRGTVSAVNFSYALHARLKGDEASTVASGSGRPPQYDAYVLNNSATVDPYRIPVMISTNYYDFGTDNRKFLRSVRIIGDKITDVTDASAPWSAFNTDGLTLTLGVNKTDGIGNLTIPNQFSGMVRSRALRTQTDHRYNFNNFGAFRKIRFYILINTYVPVRLEALELTIAQGTH